MVDKHWGTTLVIDQVLAARVLVSPKALGMLDLHDISIFLTVIFWWVLLRAWTPLLDLRSHKNRIN